MTQDLGKLLPTDDELYEDWLEVCRPFNGDATTDWLRGHGPVKAKVVAKARANLEIANMGAVNETIKTVSPAIDAAMALATAAAEILLAMSEPQNEQRLLEAVQGLGMRNSAYLQAQVSFQALKRAMEATDGAHHELQ